MAINYLNNISLNKNELQQAVIENQPNDAAAGVSPVEGQLYFDTTNHILKQYDGSNWKEVGGGVQSVTTTDGTYIDLTPNVAVPGAVTITADLSASGTGDSSTFLRGDNTWATPPNSTYDLATASTGTAITLSSNDSSPDNVTISGTSNEIEVTRINGSELRVGLPSDVTIGNNLTVTNDLTVSNDATIDGDLTVSGGGDFATLGVTGATAISGLLTAAGGLSVTGATLSASANTAIDLGANRVTNIADPTTAQDAATKAYVDAATVGGLIYQGAYNPVTNTPDIDRSVVVKTVSISSMGSGGGPFIGIANTVATTGTGQGLTLNVELNQAGNVISASVANGGTGYAAGDTVGLTGLSGHSGSVIGIATIATAGSPGGSIGIETGWTYTVVADGTFYGEAVGIGDVLISETENPGNLVNWTTVQNNIDLASATQVGIGNVAPGEAIDVAYSGGTATVSVEDSTALNKGAVIVAGTDPINVAYASGTATVSIEDSATDQKGAVSLEGSNGITVSYTNGHAIIFRDATIFNAVRRSLDTTVSGNPGSVTRTVSGGTTTFTVNTNSMGLGAASALDVKAEVMSAAGQTVYADITRSGNVLSVIFTGTVNDGDYEVLMSATVNRG